MKTLGAFLLGIIVVFAGCTPSSAATKVHPQDPTGLCTSPIESSSDPSASYYVGKSPTVEHWWVSNDAWSGTHGPQSINVCGAQSWYSVSNQPNNGGQVETYPDTEYDVGGRASDGSGAATTKPISAYTSITSTYAESNPMSGGDGWDAAYDLWTNQWGSGAGTETMIWNQWAGGQGYWADCSQGIGSCSNPGSAASVNLGAVNYHFYANGSDCNTTNVGGCELMFFRDRQKSSGSVDLLAAFNWEVANGYASASDVPTQLEYGTEVAYTTGDETFNTTGLTITLS